MASEILDKKSLFQLVVWIADHLTNGQLSTNQIPDYSGDLKTKQVLNSNVPKEVGCR